MLTEALAESELTNSGKANGLSKFEEIEFTAGYSQGSRLSLAICG